MDRTVITFSAENTITIFLMVISVSVVLAFGLKLMRGQKAKA